MCISLGGDPKHGIYHIGSQRGLDVLRRVLRAVAIGAQLQYVAAKKAVRITHEGMVAVLSRDEHGKPKTWLLTGWEEGKPDAHGEVGTRTAATQPGPTFSRTELGAGFLNNIATPEGPVKGAKRRSFPRRPPEPGTPKLRDTAKWEEAVRRWGGTPRVLARTDESVSSSRPLTASRDADQPDAASKL